MTDQTKYDAVARAPDVMLPYQADWIADLAAVKVYEKGRRTGITWAEAADCTLLASKTNGMDTFYVGTNKEMAAEFIEDCAGWAGHYEVAATSVEQTVLKDEDKDILIYQIRFASGHKVMALSSRPSNLRGRQGRAVFDEAAFHDDLAGLLKAGLAFLMWGGQVHIISTHNGADNPFAELVEDVRAKKLPYSPHRTTFDDALDQGLYQRICLKKGEIWTSEKQIKYRASVVASYGGDADEELFCIPSKSGGVYLPGALVKSRMNDQLPVIRWNCVDNFVGRSAGYRKGAALDFCDELIAPILKSLDPNLPCWFGEDFGRSGDLTVIAPYQRFPSMRFRVPFAVELRNVPFEQQRDVLFYICDRLPNFRGGALDAGGNGQYLAEVAAQRYGAWRIQEIHLSQAYYIEAFPRYKAALEDGSVELPADADLLDDHRAVRMEKGIAKVPENYRGKGADGGKRHGDGAIACLLGYIAAVDIDVAPLCATAGDDAEIAAGGGGGQNQEEYWAARADAYSKVDPNLN